MKLAIEGRIKGKRPSRRNRISLLDRPKRDKKYCVIKEIVLDRAKWWN